MKQRPLLIPWFMAVGLAACTGGIGDPGRTPQGGGPTGGTRGEPGTGGTSGAGRDMGPVGGSPPGAGGSTANPPPGQGAPPAPAASEEEIIARTAAGNEHVFRCEAQTAPAPARRLRRLTGDQIGKTVAALLNGRSSDRNLHKAYSGSLNIPFTDINTQDTFTTRSSSYFVSVSDMEKVFDLSDEVASRYALKLTAADRACLEDPALRAGCISKHLSATHELLIGRPLPEAKRAALVAKHAELAQAGSAVDAVVFVLRAIMVDPSAYLLDEVGDASGALDSFSVARSLSYTLTDGPPDKALWQAAQAGTLTRPEVLKEQILRLLAEPTKLGAVKRLFLEWYRYDQVKTTTKDLSDQKTFSANDLSADTDAFLTNVLVKSSGRRFFEELLTSKEVFGNHTTRELYGVTTGDKYAALGPIVPPTPRPGMLAQPSWLIAFSDFDANNPMRRAKFVLEHLLCARLPEIVIPDFPPPGEDDKATLRERFNVHTNSPACQTCHKFMDPVAFAFEEYDDLGRHRTQENGKPVDASGSLVFTNLKDPRFKGLEEMMTKLVGTERFKQCAVRNTWEYFVGREPQASDGCAIQRAYEAYETSQGNLLALVAEILTADLLAKRRAQ